MLFNVTIFNYIIYVYFAHPNKNINNLISVHIDHIVTTQLKKNDYKEI